MSDVIALGLFFMVKISFLGVFTYIIARVLSFVNKNIMKNKYFLSRNKKIAACAAILKELFYVKFVHIVKAEATEGESVSGTAVNCDCAVEIPDFTLA